MHATAQEYTAWYILFSSLWLFSAPILRVRTLVNSHNDLENELNISQHSVTSPVYSELCHFYRIFDLRTLENNLRQANFWVFSK